MRIPEVNAAQQGRRRTYRAHGRIGPYMSSAQTNQDSTETIEEGLSLCNHTSHMKVHKEEEDVESSGNADIQELPLPR